MHDQLAGGLLQLCRLVKENMQLVIVIETYKIKGERTEVTRESVIFSSSPVQ